MAPKRAKRKGSLSRGGAKAKPTNRPDPTDADERSASDSSEVENQLSDYEDEEPTEPESDEPEEEEESDEPQSSKWKSLAGRPKTGSNRIVPRVKELLKPGVKTGLGPGTQVVMKKPKARSAGKTPYTDDTIHPNTMLFLGDLAANNNRDWLKSEYVQLTSRAATALWPADTPVTFANRFNHLFWRLYLV